jgi:hypothetical protein
MPAYAQKGVTTFGLQYKPIVPNRFIGMYRQEFNEAQLISSVNQKIGHCFGGVVRHGLTKNISLETGINLTRRNFGLDFSIPDSSYAATGKVGVVSYDIPLSCLIYIQLSQRWFINTSLGSSMTLFTSNVFKSVPIVGVETFRMEGAYKSKVQGALLANVGCEFRTREKGYFYLGSSYHLPYTPIMTMAMSYEYEGGDVVSIANVRGSYLTVDFRYFFHERPEAN